MSDPTILRIAAVVGDGERLALDRAARWLGEALTEASGTAHVVLVDVPAEPGRCVEHASMRIVSLHQDVAAFETPWPQEEARLRALHVPRLETGEPFLFLTMLRHVDRDEEQADHIRSRIRRLNLLVIELSREFGICVIDIDRALADVGARRLRTDYRLGGDAIDLAARTMALGIVVDALDAVVPFEVQDGVRAIILEQTAIETAVPAPATGHNLMVLGKGRRRQRVSTITQTVQVDHVGWLVRQVVQGQIGPREAIAKVGAAIRVRGARESFALLSMSIGRMMGL